jgi:hypothetical protein
MPSCAQCSQGRLCEIIHHSSSPLSPSAIPRFPIPLTPDERQTRRFFPPPPGPPKQPVCHRDEVERPVPVMALLGVFNRVVDDSSFLVKLEDEQARELLVWARRARNNVVHLFDCLTGLSTLLVRFAARLPSYNQLLGAHMSWRACTTVLHHALRQNLEPHVAHHRDPSPCDWCCP